LPMDANASKKGKVILLRHILLVRRKHRHYFGINQ